MEAPASTTVERSGGGKAGLRQLAVRVLGGSRDRPPPDGLAALLLPMVRRAIRTERGPVALVRWLRRHTGSRPAGHQPERVVRGWTEDLVRLLLDPCGSPADTLDDS